MLHGQFHTSRPSEEYRVESKVDRFPPNSTRPDVGFLVVKPTGKRACVCKRATGSLRSRAQGPWGCVLQDAPQPTEPVSFPETLVGEAFHDGDSRFSNNLFFPAGLLRFHVLLTDSLSLSLSLFFPSVVRLGNLQFYLSGDGVTLICLGIGCWAGLVAQTVNDLPAVWFDPLIGKIPWRRIWQPTPVFSPGEFPWTEEPGGLQSMGPRRVRRDRTPDTFTFTARS